MADQSKSTERHCLTLVLRAALAFPFGDAIAFASTRRDGTTVRRHASRYEKGAGHLRTRVEPPSSAGEISEL